MKAYLALILCLGAVSNVLAVAQPSDAPKQDDEQSVSGKEGSSEDEASEDAAKEEGKEKSGKMKSGRKSAKKGGKEEDGDKKAKPEETVEKVRVGDVVTFKTGRVLSSVQVVRESVTGVEIRVLPDAPPLKVPKDQIQSIQYDNIDPNKPGQPAEAAGGGTPGVMTAQELSPELSRKLAVPLAPEDLILAGKPIVETLLQLSTRAGFTLEVAEEARTLDGGGKLVWKQDPAAGTTFSSLLQDYVVKDYPELAVVYSFDKILLTTKDAAAALKPAGGPADAPPPPGGAPPGFPPPPGGGPGGPPPGFPPPPGGGAGGPPPGFPPPPGAPPAS